MSRSCFGNCSTWVAVHQAGVALPCVDSCCAEKPIRRLISIQITDAGARIFSWPLRIRPGHYLARRLNPSAHYRQMDVRVETRDS